MHPASLQKPRPPLSITALGPKTLRIAAQYADSWIFFPEYDVTVQQALEQTARRNQMLDEYCVPSWGATQPRSPAP
jgi:alkanesulfonate monooxygenase SsuD/methylene tetrahydromethanopterin reductase-like flavin-dependent oxidoreductase (luciferase family)